MGSVNGFGRARVCFVFVLTCELLSFDLCVLVIVDQLASVENLVACNGRLSS